ncbi:unannotated protein [freshwater metagenome]|uniref:Unannotated protein n=1 Tax=freshwater metagenome TaxID=449393 RepID=A0A6J7N263_9ZZZZ
MSLTFDEHRVEDASGIVTRDHAHNLGQAGIGVDLDDHEVRPERERCARELIGFGSEASTSGGRDFGPRLRDRRGSLHVERPCRLVEHDVVDARFEQGRSELACLVDHLAGRDVYRRTTGLERLRRARAAAFRHQLGVALDERDVLHGDTGLITHQHRERRGVALPVRERTGVDRGLSFGADDDLAPLRGSGSGAGGDLDVDRHTDAQLLDRAGGPPSGLLGPQRVVGCVLEHEIERRLVVAGVVHRADRGGVRERVLRDEVLAPHRDRVHADLGCEQIHGPFDGRRCLRSPRAAERDHGRRVGDHRLRGGLDRGNGVHPRRHHMGEERQEPAIHAVRTGTAHHLDAIRLDRAVSRATDGQLLHLIAAVGRADHGLGAGLGPTHWAPVAARQLGQQRFFGREFHLQPEPATYVGRDHVARLGRQPVYLL